MEEYRPFDEFTNDLIGKEVIALKEWGSNIKVGEKYIITAIDIDFDEDILICFNNNPKRIYFQSKNEYGRGTGDHIFHLVYDNIFIDIIYALDKLEKRCQKR